MIEFLTQIPTYIQTHWVEVGAIAIALDQLLFVVSPITPWSWDDTLSGKMRVLVKKIFRKE